MIPAGVQDKNPLEPIHIFPTLKTISAQIKEELKTEVTAMKEKGIAPCLAVIQVGNDPASSVYVNNKKKACAYITNIDFLPYIPAHL